MVTNDLILYIKSELQKGTTKESISSILLSKGWSLEDVNLAFTMTAPVKKSHFFRNIVLAVFLLGILFLGYVSFKYGGKLADFIKDDVITDLKKDLVSQSKITLSGTVVDKSGNPVKDVRVSVDISGNISEAVSTDNLGFYKISSNSDKSITLTFKKNSYVPIHRVLLNQLSDSNVDVVMYSETPFKTVDVNKKMDVSVNGAGLSADAGSFIVKGTDNKAVTAKVSVTPFDPSKSEDLGAFPGDFRGEQTNGSVTNLESFAFAKVQVRNNEDEPLDLAKGKTAEITIPIGESLSSKSPDTIPLWNFDESKGIWVEKGQAKKECNNEGCFYKGKITTIASWWNADMGINNSGAVNPTISFDSDLLKSFKSNVEFNCYDHSVKMSKSLGDGYDPSNGYRPFDNRINVPEGAKTSGNIEDLRRQLTDDTMILRLEDTPPKWVIVPKSSVQGFENYYSEIISPDMNANGDSQWMVSRIIGSAAESAGISGWVIKQRVIGNSTFIQKNGTNYSKYNDIVNYAKSLTGNSDEKIEKIYNKVQDTIIPDSIADNYSIRESLSSGKGVCRHDSAVLANVLSQNGYDTSMVFDKDHMWVRVNDGRNTFDLDPINYGYVKLNPRKTGSSFQVIPVKTNSNKSLPFLPSISKVYAENDSQIAYSPDKEFCSKIGFCLKTDSQTQAGINTNEVFEIWKASGNNWSVTTFFNDQKNNINYDNAKLSISIFGQNRKAEEYSEVFNGHEIYVLHSDFINSDGKLVVIQVISNESVLKNSGLISMFNQNYRMVESTLNSIENNIINTDGLKLKLIGIDYSSETSIPVTLNSEGLIEYINKKSSLFSKPNSKAKIVLESNSIISQPVMIDIPASGNASNVKIQYAGIILPINFIQSENFSDITIKVDENTDGEISKRILLSKWNDNVPLMILVKADQKHEIDIQEAGVSMKKISVPAQAVNKVITLDQIEVKGKPILNTNQNTSASSTLDVGGFGLFNPTNSSGPNPYMNILEKCFTKQELDMILGIGDRTPEEIEKIRNSNIYQYLANPGPRHDEIQRCIDVEGKKLESKMKLYGTQIEVCSSIKDFNKATECMSSAVKLLE